MKNVRSIALAALLLSAFAAASPLTCPPVLSPDGVAVNPSCPGLGAEIFATPGSTYFAAFNDNRKKGDYDFNDLWAYLTFNATGTQAVVTWAGSASSLNNSLYYGSLELFSNSNHAAPVTITTIPGMEVVLGLFVPDHPAQFYLDGPAIRNPDNEIHAYVTSTTPEPTGFAMIGIGLIGVFLCRQMRRQ